MASSMNIDHTCCNGAPSYKILTKSAQDPEKHRPTKSRVSTQDGLPMYLLVVFELVLVPTIIMSSFLN